MNKWINKFKYKKVKQNRLSRQNTWLLLINWLLNRIIKVIAGTDLDDIEKFVFCELQLISKCFWYRLYNDEYSFKTYEFTLFCYNFLKSFKISVSHRTSGLCQTPHAENLFTCIYLSICELSTELIPLNGVLIFDGVLNLSLH